MGDWSQRARDHLRGRALWAAICALIGLISTLLTPSPPPRTAEGVASLLGAAVHGTVRPDDFVWEARGGFWADAVLGRQVLFLARQQGATQADLYRARVRLTRAGQPLSLWMLRNLTRSPLGDDVELAAQGTHAAYMTRAFGAVQGITLLDLEGEGDARAAGTRRERWSAALESWLDTGSFRGVGRLEVSFASAPAEAKHEIAGDLLVLSLGKEAVPAAVGVRDRQLNTGGQNPFGASAQRLPHRARPLGEVVVRAAGELIGPAAGRAVALIAEPLAKIGAPRPPVDVLSPASGAPAAAGEAFPPPALAPPSRSPLAGEGVWRPLRGAKAEGMTPAYAYETAIRPDPRAPEAVVRLVALDTRQVDVRLAAGMEQPASPLGLHGTGRAPQVPADRMVAAFAAGGATAGFVAEGRVFVPPAAGVPTIALAEDGHAALGPWPHGEEVPAPLIAVVQAADPAGREAEPAAPRSALGMTAAGQLVYAWSAKASAETLAKGLALAGCTQTVPLAAGEAPSGMLLLGGEGSAERLAPAMSLGPEQAAGRATSALFYALLRSPGPPAPSGSGATWKPDGGSQPAPAWLPAVHTAVIASLGAQVHVTTFAPGRLLFRLRAGGREPATKAVAALPGALAADEQAKAVAAIGLGSGKRKNARGLWIDGVMGLPVRGEGVLAIERGRPRILKATELTPGPGVDATELPFTAEDGKLRAEARDVGSMRARMAACALDDGTFAVASTTFDSDEATTTALLDLGCARVVALDRGSHQSAFMHRAGGDAPPQPRYDASVLFAVEVALSGRTVPLGR
jgi:hypothetical protein